MRTPEEQTLDIRARDDELFAAEVSRVRRIVGEHRAGLTKRQLQNRLSGMISGSMLGAVLDELARAGEVDIVVAKPRRGPSCEVYRASSAPSERLLQAHAVAELMRMVKAGRPILFAGDMAGNRRTRSEAAWAKATGLVRGEADLRVYGPRGLTLHIELKTSTGTLSADQISRHARLSELGHTVHTLYPKSGDEAARLVSDLVEQWLLEGGTK